MPDTQFAEFPQAEDALHCEDVHLAILKGTLVGLRVLQVQFSRVTIDAKQNDVDIGVCPCPPHIRGFYADLVVRLWNSGFGGCRLKKKKKCTTC